jgi:hypothetical protein
MTLDLWQVWPGLTLRLVDLLEDLPCSVYGDAGDLADERNS